MLDATTLAVTDHRTAIAASARRLLLVLGIGGWQDHGTQRVSGMMDAMDGLVSAG